MQTFSPSQSPFVLHLTAEVVSSMSWTGKAKLDIVKSESAVVIRLIERMMTEILIWMVRLGVVCC